jgi:hypothetical protein
MSLRHRFRVIAWGACTLVPAASCSAPYAPDSKLVPRTLDASAVPGDNSQATDDASGPGTIPPTGAFDASSLVGQKETDSSPQQQVGTDASTPIDNGSEAVDAAPSPPHQAPDAGPPRAHAATIVVTTVDDLMCYSPENVGAIWIAESSGAFVETLQEWGKTRIDHLVLWNSATSDAGLPRSTVDAITGATAQSYGTRVAYWNFTDATGKTVPDGSYRVYFETCDDNVPGPNTFVTFTKGPAAATFTFPDATYFQDLKVIVMP